MVSKSEHIKNVVNSVSRLIMMESISVATEQYSPAYDVDRSDEKIKDGKALIQRLKEIRDEFEVAISGIL